MVRRNQTQTIFWVSTVLALLSVVLVVSNGILFLINQEAQAAVNRRQQFIAQTAQLARVNEALVRALATTAANNGDEQLRDLLTQHGITFSVNGPEMPAGAAPPTSGGN